MKNHTVVAPSIVTCGILIAGIAGADQKTWAVTASTSCATSVAPDWVIGCNDNGAVFEWVTPTGSAESPHFVQKSGISSQAVITVDTHGNPWTIDSAGTINMWIGSTLFQYDASHEWISVAVGDPNLPADIWAIDSTQQVYNLSGRGTIDGGAPHPPHAISGSFGTKIVGLSTTTTCSAGTIHVPMVIDASKNVYTYVVQSTQSCWAGSFAQVSGAFATDIATSGYALDTLGNVDLLDPSTNQFAPYMGPMANGTAHIGASFDGTLWGFNSSGTVEYASSLVVP
jgi:hypothetical protein